MPPLAEKAFRPREQLMENTEKTWHLLRALCGFCFSSATSVVKAFRLSQRVNQPLLNRSTPQSKIANRKSAIVCALRLFSPQC
jgi:hypothetical protein